MSIRSATSSTRSSATRRHARLHQRQQLAVEDIDLPRVHGFDQARAGRANHFDGSDADCRAALSGAPVVLGARGNNREPMRDTQRPAGLSQDTRQTRENPGVPNHGSA